MNCLSPFDHDSGSAALRRSVRALAAMADRQGLWEAFQLRPGGSGSWTTAVVLHTMGVAFRACPSLITVPVLQRSWVRAWNRLYALRAADGSIGFNPATPSDADSTIWLRRALEQRRLLGLPDSLDEGGWIRQADCYIASHLGPDGVHTYTSADGILGYLGLAASASSSWLAAHGCVTLNYIALRRELGLVCDPGLTALLSLQPFWWQERSIGAWLLRSAVGFLPVNDEPLGLQREPLDNSSLSSGMQDTLQHVLALQLPSGLWPPRFTLQVPDHADFTGNLTDYSLMRDTEAALSPDNGIFTSALFACGLAATLLNRLER